MDTSRFDVDELKHLALRAMSDDREEDALRLIKAALERAPEDGELRYVLAMVHSNLGMADRAIGELTQVLDAEPLLVNCRFQLGLLLFGRHDFEQSRSVWLPLIATLAEDDPLRLFANGLTYLGRRRLAEGIRLLELGISLCPNQELNGDMARIVAESRRDLEGAQVSANRSPEVNRSAATAQHVLLAGYTSPPKK